MSTSLVREATKVHGHAAFLASSLGAADQPCDPRSNASHSCSGSSSVTNWQAAITQVEPPEPPVVNRMVHEDSGRRFSPGRVIEEIHLDIQPTSHFIGIVVGEEAHYAE